jgi:DNA repair protein RadC
MAKIIDHPIESVRIARTLITDWYKEHFIGIYFDSRTKITKAELISLGTLNACLVHPRETFKPAVMNSAKMIIVLHNHPSSDLEPSQDDIEVTQRLKKAGEILDIELYDHIIFNKRKWLSMKMLKLIEKEK